MFIHNVQSVSRLFKSDKEEHCLLKFDDISKEHISATFRADCVICLSF